MSLRQERDSSKQKRRRSRRLSSLAPVGVLLGLLGLGTARGEEEDLIAPRPPIATTVPTTAPVASDARPIAEGELRALLRDLSDPDGAVRERARQTMMGISPSSLDGLKRLVAEIRPLAPSQSVALKDIVTQVYLSGQTYPSTNQQGFLGVSFEDFQIPRQADGDGPRYGVVVTGRLPGFVGYRVLQDGDVITHVGHQPFASRPDFSVAIQQAKAGSVVQLEVLRQGRPLRLELRLDARPAWAEALDTIQPGTQARQDDADQYWSRNFEPLLAARAG